MDLLPAFIHRRIAHRPNLVKIVDNIGWLFFDRVLRMGAGLFVGVWVARYLGPGQFGLINFATAFVGLFGVIATLGLQGIVVRDLVRKPEEANATLGTAAALQFAGGLAAFGLTVWGIQLLRPDDDLARLIVVILGTAMLFKASEVSVYWFEAKVQSKYTVWVNNGIFLVFAVIKVMLILLNAPLIAFVWAMFAESALVAGAMVATLTMRGYCWLELRVQWHRAKSLLRDCWPLILAGLAVTVYMKIDQIMLGQMLGDDAVGIYSAATRVSEVWYFIPMAIIASVFPAILEAKKQSEELYYQRLQQLYDLMVILSVAVAIPMTFLSDLVISVLFGQAYEQAGGVLAIHVWASIFVFLGVASEKWFLTENRQVLSMQRTVFGAIVNVFLNLILIPGFGVIGAAWATVVSYAIAGMFYDVLQATTRPMFKMKLQSFNAIRVFTSS